MPGRRLVLGDDRDVRQLPADVVGQRVERVLDELFEGRFRGLHGGTVARWNGWLKIGSMVD